MTELPQNKSKCAMPGCVVAISRSGIRCSKCGAGFCNSHGVKIGERCPLCGAKMALMSVGESFLAFGPGEDVNQTVQSFLRGATPGSPSLREKMIESLATAPITLIVETLAAVVGGLIVAYLIWYLGFR